MKKNFAKILGLTMLLVASACGSKQQVYVPTYTNPFGGGVYEFPCSVFDTDDDFAATGIASNPTTQKGSIQLVALKNAQDVVAMKIMHVVEGEVKSFFESVGANAGNDYQQKT